MRQQAVYASRLAERPRAPASSVTFFISEAEASSSLLKNLARAKEW